MVKVIVPTYNSEKTIRKTLDSILAQTYKDFIVVVVDDYSTDKTVETVTEYIELIHNGVVEKPSQVILLTNNSNFGVSYSRYRATQYGIKSEYIAYCDSDDVWMPTHLEESMSEILHGADMVYSKPKWVNENGEEKFPNWKVPETFDVELLKRNNFIWISTVVHKNKDSLRFKEGIEGLEDWDMWIQAVRNNWKIVPKNTTTVEYLVKENGMAKEGQKKRNLFNILNSDFIINETPLKLNLGCGDEILDGYVNIDAYSDKPNVEKYDVRELPYADNTVDEVFASHVLEHFTFQNAFKVLREWRRVLKPGGKLILETPDLLETCREFVNASEDWRVRLYGHFFAWPDLSPGQVHYFLYTETQLRWTLKECGFNNVIRVKPTSVYARSLPDKQQLFLKVEATK